MPATTTSPRKSRNPIIGYLPYDLSEEVKQYVATHELTYSQFLRDAAKHYLATHRDQVSVTI